MRTQSTLAFHSLREEFVKEIQKKRENILKVDDLPIFMMFEKHNVQKCCSSDGCLRCVTENIDAVLRTLGCEFPTFFDLLSTPKFNFHKDFWRNEAVVKNLE